MGESQSYYRRIEDAATQEIVRDHLKRSDVLSSEDDELFRELRVQARVAVFVAATGLVVFGVLVGLALAARFG